MKITYTEKDGIFALQFNKFLKEMTYALMRRCNFFCHIIHLF